ncbi:hypothetical protein SO802_028870 [Lithocarpus litseifolius]|uniref:Myb/SANT-like domain-containing protein n=1 Tax=Lithocarpus litseifolius TaxID=425828 RepID=A0AAW2BTG1_9ROSI
MDNQKIQAAVLATVASVLAVGAIILEDIRSRRFIIRQPRVNRDYEREGFISDILHRGDARCSFTIRMRPVAFYELCRILVKRNLVRETIYMPVTEQVLMFLHTIGHNVRFRVIAARFHRSIETAYRYFKIVLKAVLQLYRHVVRLPDNSTPPEIRNSRRFYPYFKDCVGAIDGTHVRASVPIEIQGRFRGRKGGTTQNVLATISFDLRFTYMLAGWEGSAHDSRILNDALSRPRELKIQKIILLAIAMSKNTGKEPGSQLRWTQPMCDMLFKMLVVEAEQGNKPSNKYKPQSLDKVAKEIGVKFNVEFYASHVHNRLRTVRKEWKLIQEIRKKSGFGWDDNLKIITCDKQTYDAEVLAHPAHVPYLNKKIEQYDEMAIVVGKDMATGGFSKQWSEHSPLVENETPQNDIQNPEFEGDCDTLPKDAHEASNGTSSKGRSHRKRTYAAINEDGPFSEMTEQLKQIAVAVTALSHGPVNTNELHKVVMNAEGFEEDMLDEAFDHLVNDEKAGRAFMAKNDRMRKLWLEKFFNKTF